MMTPNFHASIWLLVSVLWSWIFAVTGIYACLIAIGLSFAVGIGWLVVGADDDST